MSREQDRNREWLRQHQGCILLVDGIRDAIERGDTATALELANGALKACADRQMEAAA